MPRRDPFTLLCGHLARLGPAPRADLHIHTTASDGDYTPSQVVALARQAGLCAIAITDHDTLAGVEEARSSIGDELEVIPGVEISSRFANREVHLLGYFVRTDHEELNATLSAVCDQRRERFRTFVSLLRARGGSLPEDRAALVEQASVSLGRRHVAELLVACRAVKTRHEAFTRFLNPLMKQVPSKKLLPVEEAIQLVHAAGGVTSLAHPSADFTDDQFAELRGFGLDALEAVYPWGRHSPATRFRELAARFGLLITGGSDCHGPEPAHRRIGSHAITSDELSALRERITCSSR
ncbi:MAG: PHP domain-containing protein [Planctomycetia bacterium]|nr:PHP domain-containing protein [Planctomycetia bacterium]